MDPPGLEGGKENNLDTGLPQEQLEPRNLPAEGPRIQPAETSSSQGEEVIPNPGELERDKENLTRDIAEETQALNCQTVELI